VTGKPSLAIKRFFDKPSDEGGRAQLQRKVAALQAKRLDQSLPQAAVSGLYGRAGVVRLRDAQGKGHPPAAGALFKSRPPGNDPELSGTAIIKGARRPLLFRTVSWLYGSKPPE
jgi:hypothetical protein